jgi:hypothetical protein
VGRYQAGAVSCASFAVASLAVLAGGPWPHFTANGWAYFAGAVLGAPVAFTAAVMVHGRRGARGSTASTLASVALGWAAAVAAVVFALAGYVLFVIIQAGYLRAFRYHPDRHVRRPVTGLVRGSAYAETPRRPA